MVSTGNEPVHLLVADVPRELNGQDGHVESLVTVWPDGTATIAYRINGGTWGFPYPMEERKE